ncbi:zinc ribbon domain-containing protein [Streptomyces cupreus]|uniref:zinc ribbon domain-containing protein n=1 Tax=Streptomyces cupreus TaxID=2759956 RepID=UPI003AB99610
MRDVTPLNSRTRASRIAGWSQFVSMLEYKARRYGRTFVKVGRFEPTSQVCSACGHRDGPEPLDVREWTCPVCGTRHDRDHNAAKNVKAAVGLAASACGAPVRPDPSWHSAKKQETGSHGIPPRPVPRSGSATSRTARISLLQEGVRVNCGPTVTLEGQRACYRTLFSRCRHRPASLLEW